MVEQGRFAMQTRHKDQAPVFDSKTQQATFVQPAMRSRLRAGLFVKAYHDAALGELVVQDGDKGWTVNWSNGAACSLVSFKSLCVVHVKGTPSPLAD